MIDEFTMIDGGIDLEKMKSNNGVFNSENTYGKSDQENKNLFHNYIIHHRR